MSTTELPIEAAELEPDGLEDDVLELSAILPPRRKARLRTPANPEGLRADGSFYELVNPEELSLSDLHRLSRSFQRLQKMWDAELQNKQAEDLERVLNATVVEIVDGATLEDVAEIPVMNRQALVLHFFVSLNDRQLAAMGPETLAAIRRVREL